MDDAEAWSCSRPPNADEEALRAAINPFVEELRRAGFEVVGTYRVALLGKGRSTILRARVSARGHFVVDSPAVKKFGLHRFSTPEEAVSALVAAANSDSFKRFSPAT
jgi:hypothetical protein